MGHKASECYAWVKAVGAEEEAECGSVEVRRVWNVCVCVCVTEKMDGGRIELKSSPQELGEKEEGEDEEGEQTPQLCDSGKGGYCEGICCKEFMQVASRSRMRKKEQKKDDWGQGVG